MTNEVSFDINNLLLPTGAFCLFYSTCRGYYTTYVSLRTKEFPIVYN